MYGKPFVLMAMTIHLPS